jgi:DNA-binding response OmpR family regulator
MADASRLPSLPVEEFPDLVLLDTLALSRDEADGATSFCRQMHVPTLALLGDAKAVSLEPNQATDDFILTPANPDELVARTRQLLWRLKGRESREVIRTGDLVIDHGRYEVSVAGRRVLLTFKEYELLRLLASAPGRVFTREELLSKVWGYDYFGGTRTVDVHVRRVRVKVEDAHHTFIETVWNVGYRFKEPAAR